MTPEALVSLLDALSPERDQFGKVSIITRFGRGQAQTVLAPLIRAVQLSHHNPVWICDPCHGNTTTTKEGVKTRRLDFMLQELEETYKTHRTLNNYLGGIHLEQTGEDVTECLDEILVTRAEDLAVCYRSLCDPRLSRQQALALIERFANFVVEYEYSN
jgi:3-deoxy-7-phosphoheptulonate synthase